MKKKKKAAPKKVYPDECSLVKTSLILRLDVGEFPSDCSKPEDFREYLDQSGHSAQECEIIKVEQENK